MKGGIAQLKLPDTMGGIRLPRGGQHPTGMALIVDGGKRLEDQAVKLVAFRRIIAFHQRIERHDLVLNQNADGAAVMRTGPGKKRRGEQAKENTCDKRPRSMCP